MRYATTIAILFAILTTNAQAMTSKEVEKVHELLAQREDVQKNIDLLKAMKPIDSHHSLFLETSDCGGYYYAESGDGSVTYLGESESRVKCHTVRTDIDMDDIKDIVAMMEKRMVRIDKKITDYGIKL